jgi:uncharacterized protein YidB (DUF937 family)
MALFDEILNAINNPNQQASTNQLGSILNTVQQLSGKAGTNPSTMETLLSVVGGYVRSSLQQTRATQGADQAQALVNQFSGTSPNQQAVNAILGSAMQQQVVQDLMQRTGLNPQTIQGLLPVLVPLALNLLQSGASNQAPQSAGSNSVLNTFLDSNRDGDIDMGDALRIASQFLGNR